MDFNSLPCYRNTVNWNAIVLLIESICGHAVLLIVFPVIDFAAQIPPTQRYFVVQIGVVFLLIVTVINAIS